VVAAGLAHRALAQHGELELELQQLAVDEAQVRGAAAAVEGVEVGVLRRRVERR
jgi:hypothetical protein